MSIALNFIKWVRDVELEKSSLRRVLISNYEPGHVRYQFGHYPATKPYSPTEEDWELLDLYRENNLKVVHVWCWQDMSGYFNKGVFEPINEKGLRKFIDECHRRGLKAIPYISPGFLEVNSPSYRPEWSRGLSHLVETFYDLDMVCPGSIGWRKYLLDNVERLMDDYGFDGLYWDGGMGWKCVNSDKSHVHLSAVSGQQQENLFSHVSDPSQEINESFLYLWGDLMSEVYARVKRRNGLVVAHIGGDFQSPFRDKCCDYYLIGEGISDFLASVEKSKLYEPYVLRFNDWSRLVTHWEKQDLTPDLKLVPGVEHHCMAASIPYLQFPWLEDGCYGEDEDVFSIPGIRWKKEWDHWTEWMKAQKKAGLPPIDGASFAPGRDRYFQYLKVFRQMTEDNTVAFLEVKETGRDRFPLTSGNRRVSVFVNDSLWVALGNLKDASEEVVARSLTGADSGKKVVLRPKSLTILRYDDLTSPPEVINFSG